jgi:hypothetical protein
MLSLESPFNRARWKKGEKHKTCKKFPPPATLYARFNDALHAGKTLTLPPVYSDPITNK